MIKLRNLDDEVLKYFRKNALIKSEDLDPEVKNIINTLKSSVTDKDGKFIAYDDTEVRDELQKLKDEEDATKASLPDMNEYLKKSDMYSKDEIKRNLIHVNDTLKASIDQNTKDVQDLRGQLLAKDGRVFITEDMFDSNFLSKVYDQDRDTYGALKKEVAAYYGELKEVNRKQDEDIVGIKNNLALCVKYGNLLPDTMLPKALTVLENNTRTKDVPLSIDDFDLETAKNLRSAINANSTKEIAYIDDIKDHLLKSQGRGNVIFATTTPNEDEDRITCGLAASMLEGIVEAVPHSVVDYIKSITREQPYLDPSTGTQTTIQRPVFDIVADVDEGGKYYTYNERTQSWDESSNLVVEAFAGRFLRSTYYHKLYFCYDVTVVDLDEFIRYTSPDIILEAGEDAEIPSLSALSRSASILVLDEDQTSRTAGKYINGEAVGTLARYEYGYLVFNDDNVRHTFRVVE